MQDNDLFTHFNFTKYQDKSPKEGYLYTFTSTSNTAGILYQLLFLSKTDKFSIEIPFYPYFLIESSNVELLIEVLKREYKSKINTVMEMHKYDFNAKNHLNLPPKQYLYLSFYTELDFKNAIDHLKKIKRKREIKQKFNIKSNDDGTKKIQTVFQNNRLLRDEKSEIASLESLVYDIHEYDVPFDITFMVKNNIRVGKYYNVRYLNEKYDLQEISKIVPPEIKVVAWDIETWKKPMQFPDPENDPVMMISGVMGGTGFLINNNELVPKKISDFEYKVEVDTRIVGIKVYNCTNESELLHKFIETIMEIKPDILTTFNGDFFDVPYLEKRMKIYGLDYPLNKIVQLDCFKWVKRDSYLPMGSQGLKAVTKIKLGYTPDDIDPEEMVDCARTDPERLAAYSVSDSIATFLLYSKYVHPFIYSLCTLIPLGPSDVLSKGSGTLCESLLIAESWSYMLLIPSKRFESEMLYEGRFCEDVSYVGGHVECLKSGIFRSDFYYRFDLKRSRLTEMKNKIKDFSVFGENEKEFIINQIDNILARNTNESIIIDSKPLIYHLDVSAMYPNIILTNRLQPISVIDESQCINCDYYDERDKCMRKMKWEMKLDFIPTKKEEIQTIYQQLKSMNLNGKKYTNLSPEDQDIQLREKVKEYSKTHYKKSLETETFKMENIVCQREIPFYVDIVKRFRDRRNEFKSMHKKVKKEHDSCDDLHKKNALEKTIIIYESLQVAHKCILNSFYGYTMRRNSRWFSMSMAAIVCHTGSKVIKSAKNFIDDIGITLELDTDGIWCLIPDLFPINCNINGKISKNLLSVYMNYLIELKYTNHQYQEKDKNGDFLLQSVNYIDFEIDGPYKAMVLPSSTEEGKLIKKKYVVINKDDKICELKGFELKRRGELKIVKRFQEELFPLFIEGSNLNECYQVVESHCLYYLGLIESKGISLMDNDIFDLFSESKNMAKQFKDYEDRKTVSTGTALKLSEFLGEDILNHKGLKCEFIISKYPENRPITERAIPIKIFQVDNEKRKKILRKWLNCEHNEIRDIIDWDYYHERLVNTILRIVILPSIQQGIKGVLSKIKLPKWAIENKCMNLLDFGLKRVQNEDLHCVILPVKDNMEEEIDLRMHYKKYIHKKEKEWGELRNNLCKINIIQVKDETLIYVKHNRIYRKKYKDVVFFILWIENESFLEDLKNKIQIHSIKKDLNHNYYTISILKKIYIQESLKIELFFKTFYVRDKTEFHNSIDYIFNYESKGIQKKINSKEILFTLPIQNIEMHVIISFEYDNKTFYIHSEGNNDVIFTDNKNYSQNLQIKTINFTSYMKKLNVKNNVFLVNSSDKSIANIKDFILKNQGIIINRDFRTPRLLTGLTVIINDYLKKIRNLKDEVTIANIMSQYLEIPFSNLFEYKNDQIYDHLFYRNFTTKEFLFKEKIKPPREKLKTYGYKKGFYEKYTIEIQVSGLHLSSILYNDEIDKCNIQSDIPIDFMMIKDLCKYLLFRIHLFKKNDQSSIKKRILELCNDLNSWICNGNRIITDDCKDYFKFIYSLNLNLLINAIIDSGSEVISFDRDIITINTGKKTKSSSDSYFDYLVRTIKEINIFSHIQLSLRKTFTKLVVVNLTTQIFSLEDGVIYSTSNFRLVKDYLNLFFMGKINDQYFYNLIYTKRYKNLEYIKTMLNIYETITNVDKLRDSCYYALNLNPFAEDNDSFCEIVCFCDKCGYENNVFNLDVCCKGCLEVIDHNVIEDSASNQISNLIRNHGFKCFECGDEVYEMESLQCKCGGGYCVYPDQKRIENLRKYIKQTNQN